MDDGFLRGHGTRVADGRLLATVCGTVERVNKLVSVRPLRTRYVPETGDVVLGLPSSGAHSNGYSLIRRIIADRESDLGTTLSGKTLAQHLKNWLPGLGE